MECSRCEGTKFGILRCSDCWEELFMERASKASNAHCTCGGGGPNDPGVCGACKVYHELRGAYDHQLTDAERETIRQRVEALRSRIEAQARNPEAEQSCAISNCKKCGANVYTEAGFCGICEPAKL